MYTIHSNVFDGKTAYDSFRDTTTGIRASDIFFLHQCYKINLFYPFA